MNRSNAVSKSALIVPSSPISRTARACPRLHVGGKYFADGKPFIFERYLEGGELLFKCVTTQLYLRAGAGDKAPLVDQVWLTEAMVAGRFSHKAPEKRGSVSNRHMMDETKARSLDPVCPIRYHILVGVDAYGTRPDDVAISTVIDEVYARFPLEAGQFGARPTSETVKTWLKRRGSYGDRTWHDCISRTGWARTPRLPKNLLALVAECALHFWSDLTINYWRAFGKLQMAIEALNARAGVQGGGQELECPSFSTFVRYTDHFATYDGVRAKYGEKAAKELVAVGKLAQIARILETAQADHTVIDIMCLDDSTGAEIGRPTLTVIIDVKSRCVLSYYISFDPPSFASVIQCFKRCLTPKINCIGSDEFPILQDIFGLPSVLVVDNGMDFSGINLQDSMNDLGVTAVLTPIASPESKPYVERLFGSLNVKAFHAVEGTTLNKASKEKRKGDYKPKASITLNALQDLVEHVIYAYHIDGHAGLDGRPPALVWQEDALKYGIPVLFDMDRLDALMAASDMRVLARDGIQLFDRMYNHLPTTNSVLAELKAAGFDLREKLKVKYNPLDLACIWFYHPLRREYIRLPSTDPDYSVGLSVYQHKQIKAHLVEQGLAFSDAKQRLQARRVVENKIYQITPGLLQKHRKAAARLAAKASISVKIEELGLTSQTGVVLLPFEPLQSRISDGGALPEGAARNAAKARATQAKTAEIKNTAAARLVAEENEGWPSEIEYDESQWNGYYDE